MDASYAFLHDPLDHVKHGGVALQHQVGGIPSIIQDLKDSSNTHEGKTCGHAVLTFSKIMKKLIYKLFYLVLFFGCILSIFYMSDKERYEFFLLRMTI